MGCFLNKPSKEPGNEQNSNRKLFQRNVLHTSIFEKNSNNTSHTPLSMISCIDRKKQYEVSTSESSVSSIPMMDLVLSLDSLKIDTSITKSIIDIEHYHDVIPIIEHQLKKKKVENMDKLKENTFKIHYKKNNIKQPEIGFKLLTNSVDYKKKIRLQKELINNIFYYEYIKQQEIDNLFRNDICLLNTQHRNNISRFS
jgi:regulator of RNase E activity RraB